MPGIQQLLAKERAKVDSDEEDTKKPASDLISGPVSQQSNLVNRLLVQWANGHLSATQVQKVAHAAVSDGLNHQEVALIAALGTWGANPANIHQQRLQLLKPDVGIPEALSVSAPVLDMKPGGESFMTLTSSR